MFDPRQNRPIIPAREINRRRFYLRAPAVSMAAGGFYTRRRRAGPLAGGLTNLWWSDDLTCRTSSANRKACGPTTRVDKSLAVSPTTIFRRIRGRRRRPRALSTTSSAALAHHRRWGLAPSLSLDSTLLGSRILSKSAPPLCLQHRTCDRRAVDRRPLPAGRP